MLKQNIIETQVDIHEWQELIANVNAAPQHCQFVAEQFAQQLQKDNDAYENEQIITDCANWAPHLYKVFTPYQQARLTGDREMYYQLQQIEDIPDDIVNPVPMPVDVAPLPELLPFFDFLRSNQPIVDHENESLSFVRGTLFKDGRMDLCKQVVGSPWISDLMDALVNNQHIKHFLLGNNIMDNMELSNIGLGT